MIFGPLYRWYMYFLDFTRYFFTCTSIILRRKLMNWRSPADGDGESGASRRKVRSRPGERVVRMRERVQRLRNRAWQDLVHQRFLRRWVGLWFGFRKKCPTENCFLWPNLYLPSNQIISTKLRFIIQYMKVCCLLCVNIFPQKFTFLKLYGILEWAIYWTTRRQK